MPLIRCSCIARRKVKYSCDCVCSVNQSGCRFNETKNEMSTINFVFVGSVSFTCNIQYFSEMRAEPFNNVRWTLAETILKNLIAESCR